MGNLCCKRHKQRNLEHNRQGRGRLLSKICKSYNRFEAYEKECVIKASKEEVECIQTFEALDKCSKVEEHGILKTDNNLELYLKDVYEKECVVKASQEEVEFIQTGIETLVQDIADEVLDIFPTKLLQRLNERELSKVYKEGVICKVKTNVKKYFKESLIDVYFPIKEGSGFEDYTDIEKTRSSIIKVGSFYERTKNHFPDEFDFIFPLFSGSGTLGTSAWTYMEFAISDCLSTCYDKKSFHYSSPDGRREIYLNNRKGSRQHGPAEQLQFIYQDKSAKKRRYIAVDSVPAYKIVVKNKPDWYVQHVNDYVTPKSFKDKVLSAESCFYVGESISFTETEVCFIKNILSKHHVKVYRILKFLINGHGDDEVMKECLFQKAFRPDDPNHYMCYSSYMIKTMMIYHHDECRNSYTTDLGPCVLQVLEEMCKYKDSNEYPAFSHKRGPYRHCLVDYLQSVIGTLKSMQTKKHEYSYENKIKSVTTQYLEEKEQLEEEEEGKNNWRKRNKYKYKYMAFI